MRHRVTRFSAALLRYLGRTIARMIVTALVFTTCMIFTLRCLGIPVPSPYELLHDFKEISKLAKILS